MVENKIKSRSREPLSAGWVVIPACGLLTFEAASKNQPRGGENPPTADGGVNQKLKPYRTGREARTGICYLLSAGFY